MFTYSHTKEPHTQRRAEIIQKFPQIRELFGYDPKTAWVTLALVPLQIGIAFALARLGSMAVVICFSYFVGSILSHWLTMTIHETSHNLALKTRRQNKMLALFANLPCIFPIAMTFHRYHMAHHAYLGVEDADTDLPLAKEVKIVGNSRVKKFFWLAFYMIVYTARGLFFISRPNRWEMLNLGIQVIATLLLWQLLGLYGLCYLVLSIFFGMSLHPVAAHFIHEHYVFSPGQETYSYYGPLNWVTFNVGYHNEHHDFMRVPGSQLPRIKKIASEYYEPLLSHRSWTYVLWHFITSSKMGLASRIIRTRDDFHGIQSASHFQNSNSHL